MYASTYIFGKTLKKFMEDFKNIEENFVKVLSKGERERFKKLVKV